MATWDLVDLDERQSPIAKLIFDAVLEWVIS